MTKKYILPFSELRITDTPRVGGKNASLGQMISSFKEVGIRIPDGFAITADAYWHYIDENKLREPIQEQLARLNDNETGETLRSVGAAIRRLLVEAKMPDDLAREIKDAYHMLSQEYGQEHCSVAVRSSATAEDLPGASFAGQQETFLNVQGDSELLEACKKCIASLFTDRAIVYRTEKGFDHFAVALSVGVQKMIRSDLASSGVAFSLDTESGFSDVVMIDSSWGLGESIVQGLVVPDEFVVHKPTLEQGFQSIIKKQLGGKETKIIYAKEGVEQVEVPEKDRRRFSLNDEQICALARDVITIEKLYSTLNNHWMPMDVEWAIDGVDGKLYIIQARPETVFGGKKDRHLAQRFVLREKEELLANKKLLSGLSVGQKIASGPVRIVTDVSQIDAVAAGDILVTTMTDPDWLPAMKRAAGIITERGGRTCHAAIVGRELGVPVIVGATDACSLLREGQMVTMDCSEGKVGTVYEGEIPFEVVAVDMSSFIKPPIELLVNIGDPDRAFMSSFLPVDGVGLARLEFIISNAIQVHPLALVQPDKVTDPAVKKEIDSITAPYPSKKDFFIEQLSQGVGMIAAAFYPKPVIVRLSDFKSNEYRNLIGGTFFEPEEANPMLGFRGAARYCSKEYKDAFALECAALQRVRSVMGFTNVRIMIPFVRTIHEAQSVIELLEQHGLTRNGDGLELFMMCEIPANVLLIDEFGLLFDGISIGSNDLTQLTLGVDRDSALLAKDFDERNPAVKKMMRLAVEGARRNHMHSGICGQAPSDYPEIATFLIDAGISSISLNPDAVVPFLRWYTKKE